MKSISICSESRLASRLKKESDRSSKKKPPFLRGVGGSDFPTYNSVSEYSADAPHHASHIQADKSGLFAPQRKRDSLPDASDVDVVVNGTTCDRLALTKKILSDLFLVTLGWEH